MPQEKEALTIARVATHTSVAVLASVGWFLVGLPSWNTYHTGVAFESLISFITVTCIALCFLVSRQTKANLVVPFLSFLVFTLTAHFGYALQGLFHPESVLVRSAPRLFLDLLELHLTSVLLMSYFVLQKRALARRGRNSLLIASLVMGLLASVVISVIGVAVQNLSGAVLLPIGTTLSIATVAILLGCAWRSMVVPSSSRLHDPVALSVSLLLLLISVVPILTSLATGSLIWTLSLTLQSVALVSVFLSLSVPYLKEAGILVHYATVRASLIAVIFLIPFLVTLSVEAILPGFYAVDKDAYLITHIGAASLSGFIMFLTYAYARMRGRGYLYPVVLLYSSWVIVEVSQVAMAFVPAPYTGESVVPYILGGLVSLASLVLVVRWREGVSGWAARILPREWMLMGLLLQSSLVLIGLRLEQVIMNQFEVLVNSPSGRSVLLVVNLLVMFVFAYVMTYMLRRDVGNLTPELIMVGFLSLWIVSGSLKANYLDWTAGWWTAEFFLLVALVLGPCVLGVLYLQEFNRAESEHLRARVFSDLLVHDVSNHHQAILLSLDLLKVGGLRNDLKDKVVREARDELRRADQVIRNVRQLALSHSLGRRSLMSIDLVQCVLSAYDSASPVVERGGVSFSISHEPGEAYVLAHRLLEEVFVNLFRNSLKYSANGKRIAVNLFQTSVEGDDYWEVHVDDHGQGISPERKKHLFDRFMPGAEGTGLGLSVVRTLTESFGGQVYVEDRVDGDYTKGARFVVRLLRADRPITDGVT